MKKTLFTVLLIVSIALSVTVMSCSGEVKAKSSENYITLSSDEDFVLTVPCLYTGTLEYSTDASEWKTITPNGQSEFTGGDMVTCSDLPAVKKLYIRGKDTKSLQHGDAYWKISATSGVKLAGNIMALIDYENPSDDKLTTDSDFERLFENCTSITDISELKLPAKTLVPNCYMDMFRNCSGLTTIPEDLLPATTLASSCYQNMFFDCTSLTDAPDLPATSLEENCYECMFSGCSSLTGAPAISATTLAENCCYCMFSGCTSLKKAPELKAEALADGCYNTMFSGCSGLCVTTNSDFASGQKENGKIFKCPLTGSLTSPVSMMFFGIASKSEFKGTPTSGNTYYWYIPSTT